MSYVITIMTTARYMMTRQLLTMKNNGRLRNYTASYVFIIMTVVSE